METLEKTKGVEFENSKSLKPSDLICFSSEYAEYIPFMRYTLAENEGKIIDLIIARIDKDGNVSKKTITGKVGNVSTSNFSFLSNEDFFNTYDFERTLTIHFNNILGDVPLLIYDLDMDPFKISDDDYFASYFKKLLEMRKLLEKCVDTVHGARLTLQYEDKVAQVDCEIQSVNKSNAKIFRYRYSDSNKVIDLGSGIKFLKFVTPDHYLSGVSVSGTKISINPFDDDEIF